MSYLYFYLKKKKRTKMFNFNFERTVYLRDLIFSQILQNIFITNKQKSYL